MNGASVKESLVKEERAKLDAIDCLKREKGGRLAAEQMQASLKEELEKAEQDKAAANERVKSLNEMYKRLQEYNTSLQQYNTKLQNELKAANDSSEQVEREKVAILENLSTLRGNHNLLQSELTSFKESRDEAIKQNEALIKEIEILRGEIHQIRDDRDRRLLQVQRLGAELISFKERPGKAAATLDNFSMKVNALEEKQYDADHLSFGDTFSVNHHRINPDGTQVWNSPQYEAAYANYRDRVDRATQSAPDPARIVDKDHLAEATGPLSDGLHGDRIVGIGDLGRQIVEIPSHVQPESSFQSTARDPWREKFRQYREEMDAGPAQR